MMILDSHARTGLGLFRRSTGAAGLSIPQTERPGAHSLTPFFAPKVYGGCCDGVFGRAVPRYGNANFTASTAISISIVGGGPQSTERPLS